MQLHSSVRIHTSSERASVFPLPQYACAGNRQIYREGQSKTQMSSPRWPSVLQKGTGRVREGSEWVRESIQPEDKLIATRWGKNKEAVKKKRIKSKLTSKKVPSLKSNLSCQLVSGIVLSVLPSPCIHSTKRCVSCCNRVTVRKQEEPVEQLSQSFHSAV